MILGRILSILGAGFASFIALYPPGEMASHKVNASELKIAGNTLYRTGDFAGAARAFRNAVDYLKHRKVRQDRCPD